ncbi:MAG: outer membrane beta-barrel protein [Hyphomicrobium sp.]
MAAGVLAALGHIAPAHAQSAEPAAAGLPTPTIGRMRSGDVDDGYAAPGIPPPIPETDPSETPEEQDGLEPTPRAGQRPVIVDGDPNYPAEIAQPVDGIVDVGEPAAPEDGTDPSTIDTREPEDLAVFENPPAGFDPLLFQVEDIDPIRDNRTTRRLASLEPYDPVGIRIGSFVLFPELETNGYWMNNVLRTPKAATDQGIEFRPTARLASNWTRHALEFRTSGIFSFYDEFDTENDKAYTFEGRGRLDVTRRTNVQTVLSHEVAQESRSAIDASSAGPRANVSIDRAEAALNHRFNRLSMQLRGSVDDYAYEDGDGAIATPGTTGTGGLDSDRDYTAYEQAVRATWEFKPTLAAFTEVEVNQRDYDVAARSDGINRSSDGQRYRTGLAFGNTGKVLRGEISLGYGVQSPDDSRLDDVSGLIVDANATWRATELTSFLFNARSDVSETTTENVGGAFTRYFSLEARHALRRFLIASAGISYTTQDSQDGVIDENEIRTTLGLEYFVNRETVLFSRYVHSTFDAIGTASDYDADEIRVGLRLRR